MVLEEPLEGYTQHFCFAVKKGNYGLLAKLNEGLSKTIVSNEFQHLYDKWIRPVELPKKDTLIAGGDRAYPPYEYLDEEGRPAGFNVDLVNAVA